MVEHAAKWCVRAYMVRTSVSNCGVARINGAIIAEALWGAAGIARVSADLELDGGPSYSRTESKVGFVSAEAKISAFARHISRSRRIGRSHELSVVADASPSAAEDEDVAEEQLWKDVMNEIFELC